MIYVYPKLTKSGLGNLLFDWARAEVFARMHNLPILSPRWVRFDRLGVWLRRERYKRYYGNSFCTTGFVTGIKRWWIEHFYPEITESNADSGRGGRGKIVFSRTVSQFFEGLLEYHDFIHKRLLEIVNPNLVAASRDYEPFIGLHIRRGDFCLSHLRTSDEWFISAAGKAADMPQAKGTRDIRVFSDAYPSDIEPITKCLSRNGHNVIVMPKAPAIQDILALSRASVLVGSPHSTFSMWAVFLGQMPSIWKESNPPPALYYGGDKTVLIP